MVSTQKLLNTDKAKKRTLILLAENIQDTSYFFIAIWSRRVKAVLLAALKAAVVACQP